MLYSGSLYTLEQFLYSLFPHAGSRFRVHAKEADNLCVSGPADLVVSEEGLAVHSVQTGGYYNAYRYCSRFTIVRAYC